MKYGIDISEFQDPSIVDQLKDDLDFVIIRAGYSKSADAYVNLHINECNKRGIPYGLYWYSYALTPADAEKEAQACLEIINERVERDGSYPMRGVWFDMEDGDGFKQRNQFSFTAANISAICNAFCSAIEDAGLYAGIYCSESWLPYMAGCGAYDKWIANWGNNSGKVEGKPPTGGSLWQYTSKAYNMSLDGDLCIYDDMDYLDTKYATKYNKEEIPSYKVHADNLLTILRDLNVSLKEMETEINEIIGNY